jgi:pimeloyl-ACP methyl ester carboxylesterase
MWRKQIEPLAARGLHVVAPDLRGYGASDRPKRIADYTLDQLAGDVVALARALGAERVRLAGHDWGGAIAWHAAREHPGLVERLAVVDCPPAEELGRAVLRDPRQLARSWYTMFFQLPGVAERLLARPGAMRAWLRSWAGSPDVFSDEELDRYADAAARPGAMHAAIAYYRAAFRQIPKALRTKPPQVRCPTLVVWGARDKLLGTALTDGLERLVDAPYQRAIVDAGHFVPEEKPDELNRLLGDFLA